MVASLLLAVFISLTAGTIVSTLLAIRAEQNAEQARKEAERADQNAATARQAELTAKEAEAERTEQLWRSLIERARAGRTSGRIGQRYDGLAALRQAAGIRPTLEIRNEAIACMALVDLRLAPPGVIAPKRIGGTFNSGQAGGVSRDLTGGWEAVRAGNTVEVRRPKGMTELSLPHPAEPRGVVWRPDGKLLAVGCEDMVIHVWRTPGGERQTLLHGGQGAAYDLAFSPSGRFLCSREIGGAVRFWDPITGRQLVWSGLPGTPFYFGPRDEQLISQAALWELATGAECRVLHHSVSGARDGTGPLHRTFTARFDPTGKRLVTSGREAVFWDPETGTELARVPDATGAQAVFLPDGEWLAAGGDIVRRWSATAPYKPGEQLYAFEKKNPEWVRPVSAVTRDGTWAALTNWGAGEFVLIPTAGDRAPVKCAQPGAFEAAFSPDGTLLATGSVTTKPESVVRVREVPSGRLIREIPDSTYSRPAFTPDGRWLVIGTTTAYQFWKVGTWERGLRIPRPGRNNTGPMAFSADGRMMACMPEPLTVKLFDPNTGNELATLTPPTPTSVEDLCFSPDGTKLVVSTGTAIAYLWDLRLIRRQLREMNLDWDPPFPELPVVKQ